MKEETYQMKKWHGDFGRLYTDRNLLSLEEVEELCKNNYGVTRTELNNEFLFDFDRSFRILEVGSNIGNQLLFLQKMGFKSLYGIELQEYAVEISKKRTVNINVIQGSAFDIPFKANFFDLVFTAGVLIHISPSDIKKVLKEIHRCTDKYIWGFEYYADKYTKVKYRGHDDLLWKADFAKTYLNTFDDLKLIKEKKFKYLENDNIDSMFLLEKV